MKQNLPYFYFGRILNGLIIFMVIFLAESLFVQSLQAQIYEPEGLNMPGSWNSWTNPPVNNLALASATQVAGGRVTKIAVGTTRWQTSFSVAATGGDLTGGSYEWLFTSGPTSNYFQNKWANVVVSMNTLQSYTKEGGTNNTITLANGKWYTMNWEDNGYADTRAIFMETSAQPVTIASVSVPVSVNTNDPVTLTITTAQPKCAEEIVYLRYTNDSWVTSTALPVTMTGLSGTVQIPGQDAGTTVSYYAFTSTLAGLIADYDLCTLNLLNNGGSNYSYTVSPPAPAITWANLQFPASGAIETGQAFDVFGQALVPGISGQVTVTPGLQMWVGYSTTDTDPATWTNWIPGSYNAAAGNNDEFKADIGTALTTSGTYYYATRFQLNADPYVYGGYNGGFWNGTTNISGTLTVSDPIPNPDFDWVNLQFPGSGTITPAQEFIVFAQAYITGVTGQATPAPGIQSWIGYSSTNTNPSTWTNWIPAPYSGPVGNNDEFSADLGAQLSTTGTYYYASRFQLNTGDYYYGGFSETGGGIWDGSANVSGVLEVTEPGSGIDWANLQFPGYDTIVILQNFDVYAQAYINGVTGQPTPAPGLQAWIGYSSENSDPDTWTNWLPATYNIAAGNNDEFKAVLGQQFTIPGTYYYAGRFQLNTGAYVYGGYSTSGGGFWDGTNNVSGVLTVIPPPATYPVLFTIIDGTLNNQNIKFKGEMTAWDTLSMTRNNNIWTLTLDLEPGTYQWGAIEDDGSPNGIWLIDGDNLVVTVDTAGNVSGTVTYTTLITDIQEYNTALQIYPNPTSGVLYIDTQRKSSILITDLEGKLLLHKETPTKNEMIDLSDFKPGIYNVEIRFSDRTLHRTIIKK
jgi:hypothetical protein